MMKYKASRFNYNALLDEDSHVWMNGVSGGAFKVNREIHAQVQAILADPNHCATEQEYSSRDQLVSLGFLIEDNFEGLDRLVQLDEARTKTLVACCISGRLIPAL